MDLQVVALLGAFRSIMVLIDDFIVIIGHAATQHLAQITISFTLSMRCEK